MKKFLKLLTVFITVFTVVFFISSDAFSVQTVSVSNSQRRYVCVGGELVGIRLRTKGVTVVGTTPFDSDFGTADPAAKAGILKGDILLSIDGKTVNNNSELMQIIEESGGNTLETVVERNGEKLSFFLTPQRTQNTGMYKGGLWVRDSAAGIGTLTFSDPETGRIATLGHGIYDSDTEKLLSVSDGEIYTASVISVTKGTAGSAGEISGLIGENRLGCVDTNGDNGVYGDLYLIEDADDYYPVAEKDEVKTGGAYVVCTVTNGEKRFYDMEITRLHSGKDSNSMTIKITDNALLALTGGIIQGMSGSPIIQNGMLIGAVTHVFVNDPKAGYAVYAQDMLDV